MRENLLFNARTDAHQYIYIVRAEIAHYTGDFELI